MTTDQATFQELSSVGAIRLVASREIRTRMSSKGFRLTTLFFVLAVVAGGLILHAVNQSESAQHIGVSSTAVGSAAQIEAAAAAAGVTVELETITDQASAEDRVRSGDLDAVVTSTSPELTIVVKDKLDPALTPMFGGLAQQLALVGAVEKLGGDPGEVTQQIATAAPQIQALEPTPEVDSGQVVAGYVAGILLFLALMTADSSWLRVSSRRSPAGSSSCCSRPCARGS